MNLIPRLEYGSTTIEFTYPPARDDGEQLDAVEKQTVALDGTKWTKVDYIEVRRRITLSFLTDAQADALRSWYTSHASRGYFFKWFDDKTLPAFKNYQLDKNSLVLEKVVAVGANAWLWQCTLEFRRVY